MSPRNAVQHERRSTGQDPTVVPEILEWLLASFLALGGLAATLGGSVLVWASDEGLIATALAEGVAEGTVRSDVLSPEQFTEVASWAAYWLGVGLVVTGLATIVVAIAYLVVRRRARGSDRARSGRERLFANAVLGAVATGLLSFVPASPVLGGAIAGYVQQQEATGGTKVGAVSGVLAALPLVVIAAFLTGGLLSGFSVAGVGELGVIVALAMAFAVVLALAYFVGLSALGGYLAGVVTADDRGTADAKVAIDEGDAGR